VTLPGKGQKRRSFRTTLCPVAFSQQQALCREAVEGENEGGRGGGRAATSAISFFSGMPWDSKRSHSARGRISPHCALSSSIKPALDILRPSEREAEWGGREGRRHQEA
jgi:hypothetical protein